MKKLQFCSVTVLPADSIARKKISVREIIQFFTHLVCLTILFLLPDVLASFGGDSGHHPFEPFIYLKALLYVGVFYTSYYFTTDPTTGQKGVVWKFSVQILLIVLVSCALLHVISHYLHPDSAPDGHFRSLRDEVSMNCLLRFSPPVMQDILVVILTVALGQAIKFIYKTHRVQRQHHELLARERENELKQLKAQLNPHFLFNTLNSIYALIDLAPARAKDAIHRLSKMLRYMLYENQGVITFGEECEFLRHYTDLMRLRLSPTFPVTVDIDPGDSESVPVAPLLFINIVENTFKHGARSGSRSPIEVRMWAEGSTVCLMTSNGNDFIKPATSSGIGLMNLRKTLELQYGGRYSLEIDDGDRFEVELRVDVKELPDMMRQMHLTT
ncbi:MAG: sensor histidine kinase [Paramuribaculum sp.]|nr:sensor histidine kinase [Paramuribaculum sp.]